MRNKKYIKNYKNILVEETIIHLSLTGYSSFPSKTFLFFLINKTHIYLYLVKDLWFKGHLFFNKGKTGRINVEVKRRDIEQRWGGGGENDGGRERYGWGGKEIEREVGVKREIEGREGRYKKKPIWILGQKQERGGWREAWGGGKADCGSRELKDGGIERREVISLIHIAQ